MFGAGCEVFGTFAVPANTQTAATVITRLIPPFALGHGGAQVQKVDGNGDRIVPAPRAYTHVTSLSYLDSGTAHQATILRPLNWTYLTAALAANGTALTLAADPGIYSTNYKYPLPNGVTKPASVADNGIGASDYVAFQLRDGSWYFGTITSGSGTAVVLASGVPNVTGGGADKNTVVYYFGVAADLNPQTLVAHHYFLSTAGSARIEFLSAGAGSVPSLNPGDPMIFYSANATNAGTLSSLSGIYANR